MFQLATLCIIKNEEMIIQEWLEHYLWQGVEHFYILDNESNDNTKGVLEPYINRGIVTYIFAAGCAQQEHYNAALNKYIRGNVEWLIVCDADEYIYNRQSGKTIRSYLQDKQGTNAISLTWKMFGSSKHELQPESIRSSFTWRREGECTVTKQIVRVSNVARLNVHYHDFTNKKPWIVHPEELALNHYAIMSKEYFEKVKMTRGDVAKPEWISMRTWGYFNAYDHKDVEDNELRNLVSSRSIKKN